MPCYSIARGQISAEIDKIEQRGERVVQVVPDGAVFLVFTTAVERAVAGAYERRSA